MKKTVNAKIIIRDDAKELTPDLAARIFFGMPLDRLIEDIRENRGGKYDSLYINDGSH